MRFFDRSNGLGDNSILIDSGLLMNGFVFIICFYFDSFLGIIYQQIVPYLGH